MCGFCLSVGDVHLDIRRLTESIKHRGPDSTRYFVGARVACGFNRLAIVDADRRSDQPMLDSSRRYLLLFNGEIYNHQKLRAALTTRYEISFETRSDTEVLLVGLILEGTSFVSKLDGIFAFAFIDLESLDVVLARDVFGVKPLYYFSQDDRLYVSSEVRPLWYLSRSSLQISNICRYLSYGIVGNGDTIVAGINELVPNTILTFNSGKIIKSATIHEFAYDAVDSAEVAEIGHVLHAAIESQQPGIRYGVLFSGGLDSTLILDQCVTDENLAAGYSIDVKQPEMSERRWQEYVINSLNLRDRHRIIEMNKADLSVESIAKFSQDLDHPLFHPNFIGSLLLTRKASDDGLKVLLSGEGADELFFGYRWFFTDTMMPANYLEYVPFSNVQAVLGGAPEAPINTSGLSTLEIFQKIYMRRWLARQDLTGMANSVEVRVPFLGLELAQFVNSLSFEFKKGKNRSKWIVKNLLSKKYLSEFIDRKKVGFDFPLNDWIGEEHIDFLRGKGDLIDKRALNGLLQKHQNTYLRNRIIFSLVSFAVWHESMKVSTGS